LKQLFPRAATAFHEVDLIGWESRSGRVFDWRICRDAETTGVSRLPPTTRSSGHDLLHPIEDPAARTRVTVTEWLSAAAPSSGPSIGEAQDLTAGILVHRLLQAGRAAHALDEQSLFEHARALLQTDERAVVQDLDNTVGSAIAAWKSILARSDVADLLSSGTCFHEVPFSLRRHVGGRATVLRGTIDCLVKRPDGSIVVLEFKTGKRRSSHELQLAIYMEAASSLFPAVPVTGHLIYPQSEEFSRPSVPVL
jgi:hypothetical protein